MKIWIDGSVREPAEARVSVLDHGLLYGDGLFEGIRIYGRRVFRLDDHLARMARGARVLGLDLPGGVERVREIVLETARAFGRDEGYVRLVVTRGVGALGVDPGSCSAPAIVCIVDDVRLFAADRLETGIDLVTSTWRRPGLDVLDPRVKSLNYLNSVLAKQEARRQGADDALLLNGQGRVAEASVANVFVVRNGTLATPPSSDGALEGITRDSVLRIAKRLGVEANECSLGRSDLLAADEMFLTGSGARIVPVRTLDGRTIGEGKAGRQTEDLMRAFSKFVLEPDAGVAF